MIVLSWSGGKDSALAFYRLFEKGYSVDLAVNMNVRDSPAYHGPIQLIKAQISQCIGIVGMFVDTTWRDYEKDLLAVLRYSREYGVTYYATGDIYLEEHRKWNEYIASRAGLNHLSPIWIRDPGKTIELVEELLKIGIKPVIVRAVEGSPIAENLGKELTLDMAYDMIDKGFDPAGEKGEYHTLVIDAPFYRYRIHITCSEKYRVRDRVTGKMYRVLDICGWRII